jgi:hypothetical protein
MDNIQNWDSHINIPSSQTYKSYTLEGYYVVAYGITASQLVEL